MKRTTVLEFIEFGIQVTCIGVGFMLMSYWLASAILSLGTEGRGEQVQRARHEAYMKLQGHAGLIRNSDDAVNQKRSLDRLSREYSRQ